MGLHFGEQKCSLSARMGIPKKTSWSLQELIDFEVAVQRTDVVDGELGRRLRGELQGTEVDEQGQRRWGFREWLRLQNKGAGERVVTATKLLALILWGATFLLGVGVIRGLVTQVDGRSAINIWLLLAGTVGVQWLILLAGLVAFFLVRYWLGGLGVLKEGLLSVLRRWVGKVRPETWKSLVQGKGKQPSALAWRLTRLLQVGGVGFNVGLIAGLFGVLWFTEIAFYWETSLSRFGGESLAQVTRFLAAAWGGEGLSDQQITELRELAPAGDRGEAWEAFFRFIFAALVVWGLVPRVLFWLFAMVKERRTLDQLAFLDPEHRKLWRTLCRVERVVAMEGMKDGVVLLDLGGLAVETAELRPFLLQKLRVNPEKRFAIGVLDEATEREAWEAMRSAPCGVVILVEGWDLSPKQMTALFARIRKEAGAETVMRVVVLGDGLTAPSAAEFTAWQSFVDDQRDPSLECLAFEKNE